MRITNHKVPRSVNILPPISRCNHSQFKPSWPLTSASSSLPHPLHPNYPPPNPKKNSLTPPCSHPLPRRCLSALMVIIATEWICRFPWMSVEPLACAVAPPSSFSTSPFLLLLSRFPSLSFSFSMRIKREERDGEGERGSFCQRLRQFPMPDVCHLKDNHGRHRQP